MSLIIEELERDLRASKWKLAVSLVKFVCEIIFWACIIYILLTTDITIEINPSRSE